MQELIRKLTEAAYLLENDKAGYDILLNFIGDKSIVLIGEATHGTHEFYHSRAEITKRLIKEKGFNAIAIEGDWPDAYRIHQYVCGTRFTQAEDALAGFKRFPSWMWRNEVILDFIEWLRSYNNKQSAAQKVGFYGLDIYSLMRSIEMVIEYLENIDPPAAQRARERYACFGHGDFDPQRYSLSAYFNANNACAGNVIAQLSELQQHSADYLQIDGVNAEDAYFDLVQNAKLIKDAEEYYRVMLQSDTASWNLRDKHMFETFENIQHFLSKYTSQTPKIIVWAHNSHIGDARATDRADYGEWNIGQLVKEHYGDEVFAIGYSTYMGTVTAASSWGGEWQYKKINCARTDSYEGLFHRVPYANFLLPLINNQEVARDLAEAVCFERAIGVIYRPDTELISHYFHARIFPQFDMVLHFDKTTAVKPLEGVSEVKKSEASETHSTSG